MDEERKDMNQGGSKNDSGGNLNQPLSSGNESSRHYTTAILIVIILVIAIFVFGRNTSETPSVDESGTPTEEMSSENPDGMVEGAKIESSTLSPSEWENTELAERIINSTQGKALSGAAAERIQEGIVMDPDDERYAYFATRDGIFENTFIGVYRWDLVNNRWWRITKLNTQPDKGVGPLMYRALGKEGRNLILLEDRVGNEKEVCESYWLAPDNSDSRLVTLNLDTPLDGFADYELPTQMREAEALKETECRL